MRKENGIMKLWNALAVCIFAYSSSVALAEEDSAEVGKRQLAVVTAEGEGLRETRSVVRGKAILPKRVKDLIAHMYRKPTRKEDRPSLWIEIPMADGNLKSRVFSYDVVIMADDDPKNRYFKSMYFAGVGFGEGHEDNDGITLVDVPVQDLPKGKKLTVAIRPVSSLGTKGKSISITFRV